MSNGQSLSVVYTQDSIDLFTLALPIVTLGVRSKSHHQPHPLHHILLISVRKVVTVTETSKRLTMDCKGCHFAPTMRTTQTQRPPEVDLMCLIRRPARVSGICSNQSLKYTFSHRFGDKTVQITRDSTRTKSSHYNCSLNEELKA